MRALLIGFLLACAVMATVEVLSPYYYADRSSPTVTCLSNAKQMATGSIIYASDFDDRFPLRHRWMDDLRPYVRNESLYHCPEVPKGAYGYAYNAAISGKKSPPDDANVPLIYDSQILTRNASDRVRSLPPSGRHPKNNPAKNVIAYADGHAKAVPVP